MKCISLPFLLTSCFLLASAQCDLKSNDSDRNKIDRILNSNLSNGTNTTFDPFLTLPHFDEEDEPPVLQRDEERGKFCLRNVTKCMENYDDYKATASTLSAFLFSSLPPFDLSKVSGIGEDCRQQSQAYVDDLKKLKLWALKMYDSTAKMPSGLLNGNVNQFGDFDMCLSARSDEEAIESQYCLTSMEVEVPRNSYLAGLHQLIQSHHHFRSTLEDPGHRVPRFSSINWALCIPSACTHDEVERGLRNTVNNILAGTEIEVRYEVKQSMCQKKSDWKIPLSTYIVISLFGIFFLWEIFATVYDYCAVGEKNNVIMAFSLKKNCNSLVSMRRSPEEIEAAHGVRCINAVLLLGAHKSMALFFLPYANRTEFVEFVSRPFSVIARAASLYTDPFIMISGMLTTYSILGKLNKTKKINIRQEYISRLFRIVPALLAVIMFCSFVLPWLNNGPLWNEVVTHHSEICKQNWWRNLLFIHNYFGFTNMCLTHTHHIGIDTQLFFVSPFLIYLLWKMTKTGITVLSAIAAISTIGRYYVTYQMQLSNYIHFGTSLRQLFETADNMYILPAHRATVYIMGIFLGYILRNYTKLPFSKVQINIGNTLALLAFSAAFFGPAFMSSIDYVYSSLDAAWYAAISPILWCFSFGWVIYTSQLGYKGIMENICSAKVFTLWTKISYAVYLVQFPVFFYNIGVARSTTDYGFYRMLFNLKEYLWIIALSALLTITVELPFQNLRNAFIKKKPNQNIASNSSKKVS